MLHTIDPSILFLKQEDCIQAGLLDMKTALAAVEKTYQMLGKGLINNPPKTHIGIPKDPDWDSFNNCMPCYIGGDVNISGVKWASESRQNATTPGIPYGIDITILSDPVTVLPFCILDGTIITAMRTSAVAGVFAKYTAPKGTETATLIGAGVIGRTMIMSICESVPTLKKIYLCDLFVEKAQALAAEYQPQYPAVEIIPTSGSKAAAMQSQLVIAETTAKKAFMDESWLKKGTTFICMSSNEFELDAVRKMDSVCVDYWKQIITFKGRAVTDLYEKGELKQEDVAEMSDLVLGKKAGRANPEQIVYCASIGLGALDIMVGYEIYKKAQEMGLGTTVKLWDKPLWE